ncbi:winged helix-turn-helix domain-containing protein [uncultured Paraglaciecola sp.]|uniref:winged helix-turn-helix domain-containing protein n=1 Tax=uncultured Paraglaciecola sp. TaxID=1765024 RepID=UPI0030D82718|tara:strand:- start:34406 stop:36517 length:2112 start_codon:yes stop_codon:yes gene_type:complete
MISDQASTPETPYHFADWQFNPKDGQLNSKQKSLRLQPRLAQLLFLLLSNQGHLLSRNQLIDEIWKDKIVNEDALSRCIAELRAALGDNSTAPIFIETVPKKGYRFIHKVSTVRTHQSQPSTLQPTFKYGLLILLIALILVFFVYFLEAPTEDQAQPIKSALITAQRVTTDNALEFHPALSSTGDMLAFSVKQGHKLLIKVVDDKGEPLYEISDPKHHLMSASFSPDDKKLLVAAVINDRCTVYLYHLPSLEREKISACMSPNASGIFDWSANGTQFLYVNKPSVNQENNSTKVSAIWRYDLSSKQHLQLSFPDNQHSYDTRPRFSPDGKHLALTRGNDSIRQIFISKLTKTGTEKPAIALTKQVAFITSFDWLINSQQLIYDSNVLGDRNLWLVDIESQQTTLLGARDAKYPSFNQQNSRLAFQDVHYNANIWQLDLTAKQAIATPIIQSIKYNNFPSFSPDGQQIAFVSNRKGKAAIWLYSLETKQQSQLLMLQDADLVQPNWSFDGSHLIVSSRSAKGYGCYQINLATTHYQPLYGVSKQHHACQYSQQGDIYAISKQANEKSTLVKITKNGNLIQLTDFSVERLQATQSNKIIYSLPHRNGLYSMDLNGHNQQVLIKDFNPQLDGHWTVQGDYLYYPKLEPDKGMWRRHIETGEVQKVSDILPSAIGLTLAVSPNHTQLIYSQTDGRQADIYLAEIQSH